MGRTYSCWMLNCWCITWPVGFKGLNLKVCNIQQLKWIFLDCEYLFSIFHCFCFVLFCFLFCVYCCRRGCCIFFLFTCLLMYCYVYRCVCFVRLSVVFLYLVFPHFYFFRSIPNSNSFSVSYFCWCHQFILPLCLFSLPLCIPFAFFRMFSLIFGLRFSSIQFSSCLCQWIIVLLFYEPVYINTDSLISCRTLPQTFPQ